MKRVFFVFLVLLLISSCQKGECEKNSECQARKCSTAKCVDGTCAYSPSTNCCGNLICESSENYCSCKEDCNKDKCEGYLVLETNKYGSTYTKYLKQFCDGPRCILGINKSDVREIPLIDERQIRSFKISSIVKLNKPFDITKDQIRIDLQVKDIGTDVLPPIRFTDIKVVSGDLLYGSKKIDHEISSAGESFSETISLGYVPQKPEEEKPVSIRIDYEYDQLIDKLGNTKHITDTYENMLAERIFLVNPASG